MRRTGAQDSHGGGGGKRHFCQSFDWAAATSCSRRMLLMMRYTAGDLGGGTASAMAKIGRVNLLFAAACRGMVPFGTIHASFLSQRQCQPTLWCAVCLLLCRRRRLPQENKSSAVGSGPLGEQRRLTVCSADPTAPHQSGTTGVIRAHRCVDRELVRDATPGRSLCAAARCGRCPSARRRRMFY